MPAYNVHRWYEFQTGRYLRADPLELKTGLSLFDYALGNPLTFTDPLGLATVMCQRPLAGLPLRQGRKNGPDWPFNPLFHQYICIVNGEVRDCGGQTVAQGEGFFGPGEPTIPDADFFSPDRCDEVAPDDFCLETCLRQKFGEPRPHFGLVGPGTNCKEWANNAFADCQTFCETVWRNIRREQSFGLAN